MIVNSMVDTNIRINYMPMRMRKYLHVKLKAH